MSHNPSVAQNRLADLTTCLAVVAKSLKQLSCRKRAFWPIRGYETLQTYRRVTGQQQVFSDNSQAMEPEWSANTGPHTVCTIVPTTTTNFDTPFLVAISSTTLALVTVFQTVRQNKKECTEIMEQIYELLTAIIALHIQSDPIGALSPSMLHEIGKVTETLHKVYVFVEAQQASSRIKLFFRQGEMTMLLKDCKAGLQQALLISKQIVANNSILKKVLSKVQGASLLENVTDIQLKAQKMHEQVLELIEALSDTASSDRASSLKLPFLATV
ncbi:hypothetical protein DFH08DRAFT_818713 [Mycena albidolilacea]|uniref:Uncharacterized protein n=1 Tax=Mycena albidolilacea TaxID=1033008 RepID=A0AAD6ZH73_9AGAR|nr:hypothetical protein DFH08DRAFT_818713 [Mycena albidolilacea]